MLNRDAMKMYGEVEVGPHLFFFSALVDKSR